MSNVFVNRNRSQGAYNVPIIKQKLYTTDEAWYKRAEDTRKTGDNFYKTSLRFGKNPDRSPKHVGVGWAVSDTCDYVKPSKEEMEAKWGKTQSIFPLYKAYNVFENPQQTMDQRMDSYPGPGSTIQHPAMQSNGFQGYQNSGGISRKDYLKAEINSIAERIARAKEVKGVLCLNNRKANAGSYKTPPLDLALQNLAGTNGGETAMRFYMKFPIYRPRGHGPPDVNDNIKKVWEEQTDVKNTTGSSFFTADTYNKRKTLDAFNNERIYYSSQEDKLRYGHRRANSINQGIDEKIQQVREASQNEIRSLKLAGRSTITFPRRERFNENTEAVIKEQRDMNNSLSKAKLESKFGKDDASSRARSLNSKKSMTASDISKYFSQGKARVDEDARSRMSEISKGTFRSRFKRNMGSPGPNDEEATKDAIEGTTEEVIPEITYESEASDEEGNVKAEGEDDEAFATIDHKTMDERPLKDLMKPEGPKSDDAVTVATTAIDGISVAPTEQLAVEYKNLMEQYDQEIATRKMLEEEIERMKQDSPVEA